MRHEKFPRAGSRPVTARRLQAAERALKRERDEAPLFAEEIAEEQPTAEERVAELNAEHVEYWQRIRNHTAQTWRRARRLLHSLPNEEQERLLKEWNHAPYPAGAGYFADFLWRRTGRRAQ